MQKKSQDQDLINILKENARIAITDLAKKLHVSRTTALARLQRLEREGIIKGYTIKLSDEYQKGLIKAIVMIKSPPLKRVSIERALNKIPQITSLYSISGEYSVTAVVCSPSMEDLNLTIENIGVLDGVVETQTSIILSTKIER